MKKIGILFLAAVTAFTGYAPAQAMPVPTVPVSQTSDVQMVDHRGWHGPGIARGTAGAGTAIDTAGITGIAATTIAATVTAGTTTAGGIHWEPSVPV